MEGAGANTTTTLIKTVKNGNDTLAYSYDDVGNITEIRLNGAVYESYEYDDLNQLTKVTSGSDVYTYFYDNGGNLTEVKKNGTAVKSYIYGDTDWKDLLTGFNNETFTYDTIGNPLTYRNGYTFTWQNGRELASVTNGTDSIAYTYSDGFRTSKTVNGVTTEYYRLNGVLQGQKTGEEYILFLYDENGAAYGLLLKNGATESLYYYVFNAQGDVIGIADESGTQVVSYEYSAWGELLSVTGTEAQTIGQKNPIRYRGYYYDTETGFYYLQSRYYDPVTQRFVNADGYVSTGQGLLSYNMFSYCKNNPISFSDSDGDVPDSVLLQNAEKYAKGANIAMCGWANNKAKVQSIPTKTSNKGVQFIANYEAFYAKPYDDGYGNITIGYGHLVTSKESFSSITESQALNLLANDLIEAEKRVINYSNKYGRIWTQAQFDALVSLSYNAGYNVNDVIDMLIRSSDPYEAFGTVIYANRQKSLGLYRRRMDEADIFATGIYERTYREW